MNIEVGKGVTLKRKPTNENNATIVTRTIKEVNFENKTIDCDDNIQYSFNDIRYEALSGKIYTTLGKDIDLTQSKKKYIKLTNKDYDMIFEMNKEGKSQYDIALHFNVDQSHICRILGKTRYLKSYTRKESV